MKNRFSIHVNDQPSKMEEDELGFGRISTISINLLKTATKTRKISNNR